MRILRTESDGTGRGCPLPCVAPAIGWEAQLIAGAAWMTSVCALSNVTDEAVGTVQSVSFLFQVLSLSVGAFRELGVGWDSKYGGQK